MSSKRVAVLMGGKSAEREVSLRTGARVIGALEAQEFSVFVIDPIDLDWLDRLLSADVDIAFLALHGKGYEDGTIQGVLESFDIPYTGSGILALNGIDCVCGLLSRFDCICGILGGIN